MPEVKSPVKAAPLMAERPATPVEAQQIRVAEALPARVSEGTMQAALGRPTQGLSAPLALRMQAQAVARSAFAVHS